MNRLPLIQGRDAPPTRPLHPRLAWRGRVSEASLPCRNIALLSVIAWAILLAPVASAFDTYSHVADVKVSGHSGTEILQNFPVLLKFSTNLPGFRYSQLLPGAADLRFFSGSTELNYEVDTWNPEGASYVWVQLPQFGSSGAQFTACWGQAGLTKPTYSSNGATWSNGYLGVWHLGQPNAVNSAAGTAGVAHGNTTAPGLIGSAQYFNTNTFNNWLDLGNLKTTNLTIEAWTQRANTGEYAGYNVDDVVFRKSGSFQWYQWNVDWNLQLDIIGASTYQFQHNGIFDLPLPAWTYAAVSYDAAAGIGRGYLNAVNRYADTKGPNVPAQNNNACTIGYNSGGQGSYYGNIDEVRLSRVVRSGDWLRACYETQLTPGGAATIEILPKLSVQAISPDNLVLSWPGTGAVLQFSPLLGPGATWTSSGLPSPVLSNGMNYVTVPCSAASAFYRAAMPVTEFVLSGQPASLTLTQGDFGTNGIVVTALNGFNKPVSLSASNLPPGVVAYFHPAVTSGSSILTLDVGAAATVGNFTVTVVGTGGGLVRTMPLALNITASSPGRSYTWPAYNPTVDYDFRDDYPTIAAPSNVLNDCAGVAGTITSGWWCFRYGSNANPLVTAAAWQPMLNRMNQDFAYFRDVMGWPPDKRAKRGYYSAIYLYGSGLCTDNASNTDLGGWMGSIRYNNQDWPMVLLSYYPVYSFDPACTYGDRFGQQGAVVHEGIHAILADMPGCRQAGWFHEGGNTWLQGTAAALQSGNYTSMGWLSAGAMIAPFMPIECYSGWLQDDSFGGPSAEGVNRYNTEGQQLCTWRSLLGGTQYGESFPHFMGEIVSQGSVAWIWQYCTNRVLEGLATAPGGLGEYQTRRLIKEYRARQVMCDFGRWTPAYKALLNNNWNATIRPEYPPYWIVCSNWTASCYVITTNVANTLTPERRTLPGWSGANQIPLTVSGSGLVSVDFQPLGTNMSCQLVYRATDNSVVYGVPVSSGTCSLTLNKPVKNNVVIAVICNTDYAYKGEPSRTNKYDYRLTLGPGITGKASVNTKWWQ